MFGGKTKVDSRDVLIGRVAQLVEQLAHNEKVVRSSRAESTRLQRGSMKLSQCRLAQVPRHSKH